MWVGGVPRAAIAPIGRGSTWLLRPLYLRNCVSKTTPCRVSVWRVALREIHRISGVRPMDRPAEGQNRPRFHGQLGGRSVFNTRTDYALIIIQIRY